ncbi:MAG: DUF1266 domain-containing protein [Peptococcaceae bacterium]|nr:DUF1266 domain-containing protein [Peptococcaceae bacterium]
MELYKFHGTHNITFIETNAVPIDKKPLLGTGAIMVYAFGFQGWTPQTLNIFSQALDPAVVLTTHWFVNNANDANKLIEGVLDAGGSGWVGETRSESREGIDGRLRRYSQGDKSALSAEEAEMLDDIMDWMVGYKWEKARITQADLDSITTTLAWDIERAAFIGRLAYNCGYFSEDEAWDLLDRTLNLAGLHFDNWLEYAISFMKGASIVKCDSHIASMRGLWDHVCNLTEPSWGDVWAWSPLK